MRINESGRYTPRLKEQPAAYQSGRTASGAAAEADPAAPQDIVAISPENRGESLESQRQAAKMEMDEMYRLMENAKTQAEAESESAEVQRKCLIIAARIIAGDEVPKRDYRYLAKNNLELYCKAICMRVVRKKARRHKPISDDESAKNHPDSPNLSENGESKLPDTKEILENAPSVQSDKTV